MLNLEFKSPEEFEEYFSVDNLAASEEICVNVFESIRNAIEYKQDSAELFTVSFEDGDEELIVSITSKEFDVALLNCQEKFHSFEMYDEALDVYELRKELF